MLDLYKATHYLPLLVLCSSAEIPDGLKSYMLLLDVQIYDL